MNLQSGPAGPANIGLGKAGGLKSAAPPGVASGSGGGAIAGDSESIQSRSPPPAGAGATAGLDAPKSSPTKGRGSATSGLAVGIALGGADSGPEITKLWPHWAHFPRLPASSGLNAYWRPHSGHRKDIAIALTS
jgi:hypothetical protein